MVDRLRFAVFACVLVVGCSKKADNSKASGSAGKSAPTAAAPAAPTPAAGNPAGCADCVKFTTCCEAAVKLPNSTVDKSECEGYPGETRAEFCAKAGADMQGDVNDTCKQRLADLQKEYPNVAECK